MNIKISITQRSTAVLSIRFEVGRDISGKKKRDVLFYLFFSQSVFVITTVFFHLSLPISSQQKCSNSWRCRQPRVLIGNPEQRVSFILNLQQW